jgi:hypothetical protein
VTAECIPALCASLWAYFTLSFGFAKKVVRNTASVSEKQNHAAFRDHPAFVCSSPVTFDISETLTHELVVLDEAGGAV